MGKSLETLYRELRKVGLQLVPTFDTGIKNGTIVKVARWSDVTPVGHLTDDKKIRKRDLGDEIGPSLLALQDFSREHDLTVDAALDLLKPKASLEPAFKKAKQIVAMFESPTSRRLSLNPMTDAMNEAEGIWSRTVGRRLKMKNRFVVFQTVKCKLSLLGTGNVGLDLKAELPRNLSEIGIAGGWRWRNESTIESTRELLVAVELARYNKRKHLLVPKKR